MNTQRSVTALRAQALEELYQSTTMLEVASNLLDQGNKDEAARLSEEARVKRNVSIWLMGKANSLESQRPEQSSSSWH